MSQPFYRKKDRIAVAFMAPITLCLVSFAVCQYTSLQPSEGEKGEKRKTPRRRIGHFTRPQNIRIKGEKQYLWAKGTKDPASKDSEWFDLSGSPLPLKKFQYGIGRDTIPAIDKPVFVSPDDPRLREFWVARGVNDLDRLKVIGYVHKGEAKAYPQQLLNRHELVNDTVGGKPVTVGW